MDYLKDELIEKATVLSEEFISSFSMKAYETAGKIKNLHLNVLISDDDNVVCIRGAESVRQFEHYGGFAYIDKKNRVTIGESRFYFNNDCEILSDFIDLIKNP